MTIAERIKEYRKQHHYTQKELATLINVKPTTVSGWELGRNIPSIEMLQKLADIFHVPFDELAGVKIAIITPPTPRKTISRPQTSLMMTPSSPSRASLSLNRTWNT